MESRSEPASLRRDVQGALDAALDVTQVLPLLHRLAKSAADDSEDALFAHRQLAELLAERNPWRASLHAKRVVRARPDDDRGWAALGFSQTLLGHYRYATASYKRALACAPQNPWYAHNLGHLLDVALSQPELALPWLERAHEERPQSTEIVSSLAHALGRAGKLERAKTVLLRSLRRQRTREHTLLLAWVDAGAPAGPRRELAELEAPVTFETRGSSRLVAELERGLRRLPLDGRQRSRARLLARDIASEWPKAIGPEPRGLAAAVAYAIVDESGLLLSIGEVAACYRVGTRAVRTHYASLRTRLLRLHE